MKTPRTLQDLNQMANGFQQAKVLLLGVVFGVFDHIRAGRNTAAAIAEAEGATLRGIEILLDALCALELVTKEGTHYENSEVAEQYLCEHSPESVVHIMAHRNQMFRSWAQLDETIRTGKQSEDRAKATLTDREANRHFILGMAEVSRDRIDPVLDALPLETSACFVDLGGGPAQYVCAAVQRNPRLRGVRWTCPSRWRWLESRLPAEVSTTGCRRWYAISTARRCPISGPWPTSC